jgi:hypothetical protein
MFLVSDYHTTLEKIDQSLEVKMRPLRKSAIFFQAAFAVFIFVLPLFAQDTAQTAGQYIRVPYQEGEICVVSGKHLVEGDVALIVRGRRVPLCITKVDTFLKYPEKYFARMQPKGALFQEEMSAPSGAALGGISSGWFLFGLYVLVALVFGGMSGYSAVSKGLKPIPHFFIGFFLSALGYLYVLTRPAIVKEGEIPAGLVKVPATAAPLPCPACGYTNHPSAKQCVGCGGKLEPMMESEVARAM